MNTPTTFIKWRDDKVCQVETWLQTKTSTENLIASQKSPFITDQKLLQAMQYSLCGGGKRLRSILVYAGGQCTDAKDEILNNLAGSVEAVHAYSLIHDDLPCMDNDDLRRGRPTSHKVYGDALALLAGDALHALAFEWVLDISNQQNEISSTKLIEIVKILTNSIGYNGMVGGQAIDIELTANTPKDDIISHLENMHRRKTGALIQVSLLMGVLAGSKFKNLADIPSPIIKYAEVLGLLFQIVDDYLDATEDSKTLGKTAGKDQEFGKTTYVTILGLEKTKEKINSILDEIHHHVRSLNEIISPQSAQKLTNIALWVAKRNN